MAEPHQFKIIDRLGHGQFSTVYKALWINPPHELDSMPFHHDPNGARITENQQMTTSADSASLGLRADEVTGQDEAPKRERLVALKRIELCEIQNSQSRVNYLKEVHLLQQVKHPNIINFSLYFIERNELFIVLELADGGDLSKLIKYFQRKKRLIPELTILKYFTQVCSAVEYIHSKRILHRDIKPANIFMTSGGCVKLGDFGLGRFFSQNTRDAHSIVGTFYYMSPERILESGYGFSSDVWSLGCVLYELITLNSPFSIFNQQEQQPQQQSQTQVLAYNCNRQQSQNNQYNLQWLFERITRAEYPSLDSYEHISYTLRQLATHCLQPNTEARPNMQYICSIVYSISQEK